MNRETVLMTAVMGLMLGAGASPVKADPSFQDCSDCPVMVPIPAGSFAMGSSVSEPSRVDTEGPQHRVTIPYAFAVGKYDVTRAEFARFVAESGHYGNSTCWVADAKGNLSESARNIWRDPGFPQSPDDPVVCVSWSGANAYAAWLARKTGKPYRLLSESEWEYAARGGTIGARYGSDDPAQLCTYINHGDLDYSESHPNDLEVNKACRDGFVFTSPVGRLAPNRFGLYDMLGNVWQWTLDCWHGDYAGAPANGAPWYEGDCDRRAVRGGSWDDAPGNVRSAFRAWYYSGEMSDYVLGFRVARNL